IIRISQKDLEEIIELGRRLIQIPTENPPGNYEELCYVIQRSMEEFGLESYIIRGQKDKPNVVGIWRGYLNENKVLLLSGHMDVVEGGKPNDWKYLPFSGEVADGALWGRGSADMKGAIACMIYALKFLKGIGWRPKHDLMIATTVDDEIAGKMGMKYLLDEGLEKVGLPSPTFHILGEATNLDLMTAFKGRIWVRIGVSGKAAHGGAPQEGVNAIEKAIEIALEMRHLTSESNLNPHPLLGPDTINLGTMRGGSRVNVVPENCIMEYDIRMGPPKNAKLYIDWVRKILERTSREKDVNISLFEVFEERDPVETPIDHPEIKRLVELIYKITGRTPLLRGTLSAGDLYYSLKRNIPGVWFGPGDPKIIHKVNEHVPIEHLKLATEVYINIAKAFSS
ncbi:MAG: M20 family metallopeptidase, partial [Synergistetes bacterium]|nr:M20 family metallopeptidase [Synergistota bacterium]MDW8192900.1 M20 family metallopeptidase [Synergistota bacterium]